MRRGEVIFEDYAPEWNADKPHLLASGTKSFSGVLAVCAVQDHYLELEERVADTLVEWKDDPDKNRITIRQLLSLCSGLEGGPMDGCRATRMRCDRQLRTRSGDEVQLWSHPISVLW